MRAASFKSLYPKRPLRVNTTAYRCAGRSRYSTKTLPILFRQFLNQFIEVHADDPTNSRVAYTYAVWK